MRVGGLKISLLSPAHEARLDVFPKFSGLVNVKTTILTSHKLLQEAERRLKAAAPAKAAEVLEGVLDLVREQRRFESASVHVDLNGELIALCGSATGDAKDSLISPIPVRIGARKIGELRVAGERSELSYADDVLLRRLAKSLARFLTSTGKTLVRHARQSNQEAAERKAERKLQPASERRPSAQKAAVGAAARR